jgi:superfamily II DNA or RNA helicase
VLVAPTGAGKTEMAIKLIDESQKKGRTAWFVVDRVALIDQTSDRFGQYGIDHGIIQADHWLTDLSKPIQVASAQTLARRKIDWLPDLIVIDEAHAVYKTNVDLVERAAKAKVIGLTATPFTAGMAEHWDGLVNSTTVNQLLADGFLTPLKIKACVTPDMQGVKKTFAGEFDDEESGHAASASSATSCRPGSSRPASTSVGPSRRSSSRHRSRTVPNYAGSSRMPASTSSRSAISTQVTMSGVGRSPSSGSRTAPSTGSFHAPC